MIKLPKISVVIATKDRSKEADLLSGIISQSYMPYDVIIVEGFSTVMPEALACGKPVVNNNVEG